MTRFVHIIALLAVAAIFVNVQCFAACFVPDSDGYGSQASTCCPEHQPSQTAPHSPCPHKYSELKNAESPADIAAVYSNLFTGSIAIPAAELTDVTANLLSRCALNVKTPPGTPPKSPLFLTLSILRI